MNLVLSTQISKGQRSDMKIILSTQPLLKMVSKLFSLILILFTSGFVDSNDDHFSDSSTTDPVREIRDVLSTLKESVSRLKGIKDEIIAKIDPAIENKLQVYDSELKDELSKIKKDIIGAVHDGGKPPTDCRQAQMQGNVNSGIYRIQPDLSSVAFLVWCEMDTRGGGWTHVLNRFDGSVNFNLNWTDYKYGFGKASGEHWLGLQHLYELTNSKSTELLFELVDWDLKQVHAVYDDFQIGNENEYYTLQSVGNYTGDAGDSFTGHVEDRFSTADQDRDQYDNGTCAYEYEGGWWYHSCYNVCLTGRYVKNPIPYHSYESAIEWELFHGLKSSLKEARMMVRPTGK